MVDDNIFCRKKGCGNPECEEHHLVPKCLCEKGGADKYVRKYLCLSHHAILHLYYLKVMFHYVPDDKKEECRQALEKFAVNWINTEGKKGKE
jgi:hypothetical protein